MDTQEEILKSEIRAMFARVTKEHRPLVLEKLKQYPSNEQKRSFLRGWLKPVGLPGRRV